MVYMLRQFLHIVERENAVLTAFIFIVVVNYLSEVFTVYYERMAVITAICIVAEYFRKVIYKLSWKNEKGIPYRNRRFTKMDRNGFVFVHPDDKPEAIQYLYDLEKINKNVEFISLGGRYSVEKMYDKLCLFGKVNYVYKGELIDEY